MRKLFIALGGIAALVAVPVAAGWLLIRLEEPEPPSALLADDPTIDLAAYEDSDPPETGEPAILVLGTAHFAQADHDYRAAEFDRVTAALAEFEPDLVAVEHLPPDWPAGAGRDYRPGFDLDAHAQRWGLARADAATLLDDPGAHDPCAVGRAHFLQRDLVNARYWWDVHDCPDLDADEAIAEWWRATGRGETVRFGHPVARAAGLDEIVSFDYQGEDARWFLPENAFTLEALGSPRDLLAMLPDVNRRSRQLQAHSDAHDDTLVALLTHLNSPTRIALQYWAYEQAMPEIEVRTAGRRQRDSFWRRNERMFEQLDDVVRERQPDRVLVITGAGHKYFLDELARDAGYRWVDPSDYLPRG